ncbi:carbohydrate ABC transporter permease [Spirochaeta cellobiosiphila]|uniref:carbohydrate ABC transporter permease n=1 Tax=Spirochaeta cellobiosiphila TaxID=504483 RepID=UPI000416AFC9|nr:sugar ABC transporter permease [Spirochaeta cellobiosiphila]
MKKNPLFKSKKTIIIGLVPTIIILIVFLYIPVFQGISLSFHRANLLLGTRKFIGWDNYLNLWRPPLSPAYFQALFQTILLSVFIIFPGIALSYILALLAHQPIKGARLYRILLIWPFALSPAVAGTIMSFIFNPEVGIVNQILEPVFHIKPRWLDTPILTFFLVVGASIWKNLGYNIVFYLAAFRNVPKELMEAAEIDGAGWLRRNVFIRFPLVGPITFFLIFTNLSYSFFEIFGLVDILTKGGPIGSGVFDNTGVTTNLIYKIFQDGFGGSSNIGFAASQGVILLIIIAGLTFLQFRLGSAKVYYGGE